ncbi:hypothetical protein HRG_002904 [Hirsutella rhossiliensis]|uniref:Uncharacterized protein n=1 Tax=Hirsutella rhossiliensis TaxID=111463 RepID=A0A9P8MZG8_9HYPO|nr:uncharacterized protein HRG_02904 [Hirsutella rhossiliensis]KAH0964888.1 hypothetical protein HRG_02904 [Hirsutella rhossiliensis]
MPSQKNSQAKAAPTSTRLAANAHPTLKGTTTGASGRPKKALTTKPPTISSPNQHREALRTAEAREAALRVARMRRLDERENRSREAAEEKLKRDSYQGRYKSASKKWTSTIVALPILLVTSYYLFQRRELAHHWPQVALPNRRRRSY